MQHKLTSDAMTNQMVTGTVLHITNPSDSLFDAKEHYVVHSKYFDYHGWANYLIDDTGDMIAGISKKDMDDTYALRHTDGLYSVDIFDELSYEIIGGTPQDARPTPDFRGKGIVIEQRGTGYTLDVSGDAIGAYTNQADLLEGLKKLFKEGVE